MVLPVAETKIFEIRDRATMIPVMVTRFQRRRQCDEGYGRDSQLIWYGGWDSEYGEYVMVNLQSPDTPSAMHVSWNTDMAATDTYSVAMRLCVQNWGELSTGDILQCGLESGRVPGLQRSDLTVYKF